MKYWHDVIGHYLDLYLSQFRVTAFFIAQWQIAVVYELPTCICLCFISSFYSLCVCVCLQC